MKLRFETADGTTLATLDERTFEGPVVATGVASRVVVEPWGNVLTCGGIRSNAHIVLDSTCLVAGGTVRLDGFAINFVWERTIAGAKEAGRPDLLRGEVGGREVLPPQGVLWLRRILGR